MGDIDYKNFGSFWTRFCSWFLLTMCFLKKIPLLVPWRWSPKRTNVKENDASGQQRAHAEATSAWRSCPKRTRTSLGCTIARSSHRGPRIKGNNTPIASDFPKSPDRPGRTKTTRKRPDILCRCQQRMHMRWFAAHLWVKFLTLVFFVFAHDQAEAQLQISLDMVKYQRDMVCTFAISYYCIG